MKLLFTAIVNVVIISDIVLLLLQQLHFPHRCIMDLRKFPLDSQVGNPCQKIVNNFRMIKIGGDQDAKGGKGK